MTLEDIKRNIWRNTFSNYLYLGLRLVLGLIMFRMIYRELTKEEFGFWAWVWSVFGYGVLLDFGFGFTAQKRVAELSIRQEWTKLSQVLSTIFFSYVGLAAVIVLVGVFGSDLIMTLFSNVSEENQERFAEILIYFFCGLGLAFPLGLFPEMLRGQQRIALANAIFSFALLINFTLVVLAVHYHWGLKVLFLTALLCTFIPDLICGLFAMQRLTGVKISPRFFSTAMVRETMTFSVFAYVTTVSNLLLGKTDQLVIGATLGLAAVALYQAGAKVAEIFTSLSQQLPETLSPVAAHLHARGDRQVLQRLLIDGTRFTVMIETPVYLICAFYMDGLLRLLTGESVSTTFWVGQVLLFWTYTTVVTQSVSKRIYMMCGHERRLMFLGVGEAVLNLALSVGLVLYYRNVLCVALGSLISTFIFGWFFLWPWAAREARLSGWTLARMVLGPTWLACVPLLVLIAFERLVPFLDFKDSVLLLGLESVTAMLLVAWSLWRLALTRLERDKLAQALLKMIHGRRPA
jgi:O-antigen/teichoic acid export membrane protein